RVHVDAPAQAEGGVLAGRTVDGPDGGPGHRRSERGVEGPRRADDLGGVAGQPPPRRLSLRAGTPERPSLPRARDVPGKAAGSEPEGPLPASHFLGPPLAARSVSVTARTIDGPPPPCPARIAVQGEKECQIAGRPGAGGRRVESPEPGGDRRAGGFVQRTGIGPALRKARLLRGKSIE